MTYNSDQVYEKIIDSKNLAKKSQVGVDLTVRSFIKIIPEDLIILDKDSKIKNFKYEEMIPDNEGFFYLEPNSCYQVKYDQGLKELNNNEWARITVRSSLNRVGVQEYSAVFDCGYYVSEEEGIGTAIYTSQHPIKIHIHSRIAQIQIFENYPTDNLYNGRWQGTNKIN